MPPPGAPGAVGLGFSQGLKFRQGLARGIWGFGFVVQGLGFVF